MVQRFRALLLLQGPHFDSQDPHGDLQLSVILVLGGLMLSSYLSGHQTHSYSVYIYICKIFIHIK